MMMMMTVADTAHRATALADPAM